MAKESSQNIKTALVQLSYRGKSEDFVKRYSNIIGCPKMNNLISCKILVRLSSWSYVTIRYIFIYAHNSLREWLSFVVSLSNTSNLSQGFTNSK